MSLYSQRVFKTTNYCSLFTRSCCSLTACYKALINGLFLYQIFSYMKKILLLITSVWLIAIMVHAQSADAGNWKTWFIPSGKEYKLPPPVSNKQEIAQVLTSQQNMDA